MSKMPSIDLRFLESPEYLAAQAIRHALRRENRRLDLRQVRVVVETKVPDASDTVFGYQHVRIALGPKAAPYARPLCQALSKLTNVAATRAADEEGVVWFHGGLTQLADIDAEALAKQVHRFAREQRPETYRGH